MTLMTHQARRRPVPTAMAQKLINKYIIEGEAQFSEIIGDKISSLHYKYQIAAKLEEIY